MLDALKMLPLVPADNCYQTVDAVSGGRSPRWAGRAADSEMLARDGGRFVTLPLVFTRIPKPDAEHRDVSVRCSTTAPPACIGSTRAARSTIAWLNASGGGSVAVALSPEQC
jgi:hypothetical protein